MSSKVRFVPPSDYNAVNVAEVASLTDDYGNWDGEEMWLLRVPTSFDMKLLHGKEIDVSEWSNNQFKPTKDTSYVCAAFQTSELSEMSTVFPNKEIGKMVAVPKPLAGLCCVLKDFTLPFPTTPVSAKAKVEMPSGLKARFVPFGAGCERLGNGTVKNSRRQAKTSDFHSDKQTKLHKSKKHKRQSSDFTSPEKHKSPKKKKKRDKD